MSNIAQRISAIVVSFRRALRRGHVKNDAPTLAAHQISQPPSVATQITAIQRRLTAQERRLEILEMERAFLTRDYD